MIVELDIDPETRAIAVVEITGITPKNPETMDPAKVDIDVEYELLAMYHFAEGAD